MTVSTTQTRFANLGDGSTTDFSFSCKFFVDANIVVKVVTTATGAILATPSYTIVSKVSDGNGGYSSATVRFAAAPATGTTVIRYLDIGLTQEVNFTSEGNVLTAANRFADRDELKLQRVDDRLDRALVLNDGEIFAIDPTMPNVTGGTAGQFLALGSGKTSLIWATGAAGGTISAAMLPVATAATVLAGAQLLGEAESGYARTSWYGTNDAALSSAKTTAGAGGVVIIDNAMTLTSTATLVGYIARFEGGSIAPPASSATLTFDYIEASPYLQIFTGANISRVRFNKQGAVYAPWFGQVANGTTDDSDAINAAIGALPVSGGDVYILGPTFAFDAAIVVGDGTSTTRSTRVGVRLIGMVAGGGAANGEWGTPNEGVRGIWTGANSTTAAMLDIRGPIHSCHFKDLMLDGAGLAGIGVKARMLHNCRFDNVRVTRWTTTAWDLQAHDAALPSGVAVGFSKNTFVDCGCFTPWDSGAFATAANALNLSGGAQQDIAMSRNLFLGGDWHFGGAANTYGIRLHYADNNTFINMLTTPVGGGSSGDSVRLVKNTTGSNVGLFPLENTFVQCPGVEDFKVYEDGGAAISAGSGGIGSNLVLGHSTSDGAAVPAHEGVTALLHTGELTNLTVRDDRFYLKDNSDGTKKAQFQLSGITTGTTRTKTLQDVSGTIYESGGTDVALADGGTGASTDRGACANVKSWHVLAASAVSVSHTGNTNETILATIAVPAGAMGPNGQLRITTLWSFTNSANNKTMSARLGGIGGTAFQASVQTAQAHQQNYCRIANRNSAASQVSQAATGFGFNANTAAVVTGAINTANAQDLVITATLANAGETLTLESYLVELFYQA